MPVGISPISSSHSIEERERCIDLLQTLLAVKEREREVKDVLREVMVTDPKPSTTGAT